MASRAGSRGNSARKTPQKRAAKAAPRKTTSRSGAASRSTASKASGTAAPSAKKARVSARTKKNLRRAGAVVAGAAAAAAVGAVIKKVARKVASRKKAKKAAAARTPITKARKKVEADIPMDRIENAYTPTQTSLKAPFRATGKDRSRDQEFARGVADDKWRDEDVYTNKSGDPRIGTHGRTYEPKEKSGGSRSDENR